MKKLLAIFVALCLVLACGCGSDSTDVDNTVASSVVQSSSGVSSTVDTSSKETASRLTDDQIAMTQHLGDWGDKVDEINAAKKGKFTFAVQTDIHHHETDALYYGKNLAALSNFVELKFVANLGDLTRGYSVDEIDNPENMKACMVDIVQRTITRAQCPVFMTVGNHDTNKMWCEKWADHTMQTTPEEQLAFVYEPLKEYNGDKMITNEDGSYYYMDFPEDKIRVVMLNTSNDVYDGTKYTSLFKISDRQVEWFKTEALNTDYAVIVMSHVPLDQNFTLEATGETTNGVKNSNLILDAVEEFAAGGGEFIAYFVGHEHEQYNYIDDNGRLYLSFKNGGKNGEVVMIDTASKVITTIGLGSAQNREFTYN